jgi:hypothetical protein
MRRLLQALRELRRSERGIALPVAVTVTFVGLGLAAVPVLASINTQNADSQNQGSNQALAAAEAGANIALLRQSQLMGSTTAEKPCVALNGVKLEAQAMLTTGTEKTWCAAVTMTSASNPAPPPGTEVVYRVLPCFHQTGANSSCSEMVSCDGSETYAQTKENLIWVVSEGKATVRGQNVTKRVQVVACAGTKTTSTTTPPVEVFEGGEVVGIESLYFSGNSKVYNGGAASNGTVQIIDSSKICGGLRYGPGTLAPVGREEQVKNVQPVSERPYSNGTGGGVCSGEKPLQGPNAEYPPVVAPENIATENSDSRLTTGEDKGVSDCGHEYCNLTYNASNRSLEIKYGTLTLGGSKPYWLCSFVLTGGAKLIAAPGAKIRIFFDTPKNCSGLNGANQLTINGGTTVEADSGHGPGFYFLGNVSGEATSKVYFGNGAASGNLVIYAPRSEVWVAGGINLNGAILGRTMKIEGGANINPNARYVTPPSSEYLPETKTTVTETKPFTRQSYVQCSSSGTLASGC